MTNEDLVQAIQNGEQSKTEQLWQQTERFVCREALRRITLSGGAGGTTFEDLYQSGYLALISAVRSYDSKAGMSFIGWLSLCLKSAFTEAEGRRSFRQKQDPLHKAISLHCPNSAGDNEDTLEEYIADPDSSLPFEEIENKIQNKQLRLALEKALDLLPPKQNEAIRCHYILGYSLLQTGAFLGVSSERARQLEEYGILKLREGEARSQLETFVNFRTPYYLKVGTKRFNTTQSSATEQIILIRERLREYYSQCIGGEKHYDKR